MGLAGEGGLLSANPNIDDADSQTGGGTSAVFSASNPMLAATGRPGKGAAAADATSSGAASSAGPEVKDSVRQLMVERRERIAQRVQAMQAQQ